MPRNFLNPVNQMERVNLLLDLYGELLTDKQRKFVTMHYGNDLSFGEIASQYDISRQAIYDAVKHAIANLEKYEKAIGLLERLENGGLETEMSSEPAPVTSGRALNNAVESLEALKNKVRKQNIIYNVNWIIHDIDNVLENLKQAISPGEE